VGERNYGSLVSGIRWVSEGDAMFCTWTPLEVTARGDGEGWGVELLRRCYRVPDAAQVL
jgi:hypothetical protein